MNNQQPTCRNCGKELSGSQHSVYDPKTRESAKWNWYGGWVCSSQCDYQASLELERSMPGHMGQTYLTPGGSAHNSWKRNWPDNN